MASVVGTSTTNEATGRRKRLCFYAQGLFWVFYSDGTNLVYCTSSDGVTWSGATNIRACISSIDFSIYFDGTYVYYASTSRAWGAAMVYRRGEPQSDGSITWSALEQTAYQVAGEYGYGPDVVVDTDGYPFIGFRRVVQGVGSYPYATKSSANDGTWVTDGGAGFPFQLNAVSDATWIVLVIPLASTRMYIAYSRATTNSFGRVYDGGMGGEENLPVSMLSSSAFSGVGEDSDVHMAFLEIVSTDIHYSRRTWGVGWGALEDVHLAAAMTGSPVLSIDPDTGFLYCFWMGDPTADHVYYNKRTSSGWGASPTDWFSDTDPNRATQSCFDQARGNAIGVTYNRGLASPFDVMFVYLFVGGGGQHHLDLMAKTII